MRHSGEKREDRCEDRPTTREPSPASGRETALGIAGVILCLVVGMGVILLVMGAWKQFARETFPLLRD